MKKWIILGVIAVVVVLLVVGPPKDDPTEGFIEVQWPTSELVSRLPVPDSTFGSVSSETEQYFSVDLGEVSRQQYDAYIGKCQEVGFTVDYSKSDTSFSAMDADGFSLHLSYNEEDEIMDIVISSPRKAEVEDETVTTEKDETETTEDVETETTTEADSDDSDALDGDFKAAMDAYEAFMDDYVVFMKKYQADPTDVSLLSDYTDFVSDYADYCDEFAAWEDEDLSSDELAYYLEVQARVSKKLLEVAG